MQSIGASENGAPVGLVVLQHLPASQANEQRQTRILSIMVAKDKRRCGIGKALLAHAEDLARAQGVQALIAQHSAKTKERIAFEALLASQSWTPSELLEFRLTGPADWITRVPNKWPPLLARLKRQGYSTSPWAEITAEDRRDAEAVIDEGLAFPLLNYAPFEPHMDPAISIALRQHGKLVGWVLGETLPETGYHHYTCGHVRPDLQPKGWLIAGIHDVCALQDAVYGAKSVAAYETSGENTSMIHFMRRKMSNPLWMDERFQSTKVLA